VVPARRDHRAAGKNARRAFPSLGGKELTK